MKRLAIITTHPIQYNAPWFRLLAERGNICVKVFYTWSQVEHQEKFDPGFGKNIHWDIPLLEGYDYTFVNNISRSPGSKTFRGIQNPTLIREVEEWGAEAVLIFGWKFRSHLKALKYFKNKIPVLFRGDSTLLDSGSEWKRFFKFILLRRVFKNIDYALFVGSANEAYFRKAGLKKPQLIYVPHAIDNKRFEESKDEILAGWPDNKEGKMTFLFAGKLEEKKNPALLLSVFANRKLDHCRLILVGNGPLEKRLKSEYENLENVFFMSFQNQQFMPSVFKKSDVFVLPSQGPGETWGLAVNEAMACGKPVLVSDKCGCAGDLVDPGKTGFIFRSGDEDDLADKIIYFSGHKDDLPLMGKNASEKIQDWSFEKIVLSIEKLVKEICK